MQPYSTTNVVATAATPITFGYANTGNAYTTANTYTTTNAGYTTANAYTTANTGYTTTAYQPAVIGTSQVHNYATTTTAPAQYVTETRVVEPVRQVQQQVVTTTTTPAVQTLKTVAAPAVAATTTVAKQTDVI